MRARVPLDRPHPRAKVRIADIYIPNPCRASASCNPASGGGDAAYPVACLAARRAVHHARHAPPEIYPDPDIIVVDPAFGQYLLGITAIRRLWTGSRWAEGPAWPNQGQYLVFSDVQASNQYRYIWENGMVTKFRDPSFNSN